MPEKEDVEGFALEGPARAVGGGGGALRKAEVRKDRVAHVELA